MAKETVVQAVSDLKVPCVVCGDKGMSTWLQCPCGARSHTACLARSFLRVSFWYPQIRNPKPYIQTSAETKCQVWESFPVPPSQLQRKIPYCLLGLCLVWGEATACETALEPKCGLDCSNELEPPHSLLGGAGCVSSRLGCQVSSLVNFEAPTQPARRLPCCR